MKVWIKLADAGGAAFHPRQRIRGRLRQLVFCIRDGHQKFRVLRSNRAGHDSRMCMVARRGDRNRALRCAGVAGIPCWVAPRDVKPSDFYADAIVQAINRCPVFVLALSQAAIDSPHVLRAERASSKRRPIATFRIDTAPLPPELEYSLSASQWLDASGGDHRCRAQPKHAWGHAKRVPLQPNQNRRASLVMLIAIVAAVFVYFAADRFWLSKPVSAVKHEAATHVT
jgi:hypothetical protein